MKDEGGGRNGPRFAGGLRGAPAHGVREDAPRSVTGLTTGTALTGAAVTGRFLSLRVAGLWVERWKLLGRQRVPVFEFENDPEDPLTVWVGSVGYRPNRRFDRFDFMSVPLLLQGSVSALLSPEMGAVHDSGYEFHGLWVVTRGGEEVFREMARHEVDEVLRVGVAVSHGRYVAGKVWGSVRLGGGKAWERAPFGENRRRYLGMRGLGS